MNQALCNQGDADKNSQMRCKKIRDNDREKAQNQGDSGADQHYPPAVNAQTEKIDSHLNKQKSADDFHHSPQTRENRLEQVTVKKEDNAHGENCQRAGQIGGLGRFQRGHSEVTDQPDNPQQGHKTEHDGNGKGNNRSGFYQNGNAEGQQQQNGCDLGDAAIG